MSTPAERARSAYHASLRKSGRTKKGRREFNDPPWGEPMTANEYIGAHEGWRDRLLALYGHVSAINDGEVYENQCGGCRFYMPIEGRSAADWGACGNPASARIGTVVFEHHGCGQHSSGQPGYLHPGAVYPRPSSAETAVRLSDQKTKSGAASLHKTSPLAADAAGEV